MLQHLSSQLKNEQIKRKRKKAILNIPSVIVQIKRQKTTNENISFSSRHRYNIQRNSSASLKTHQFSQTTGISWILSRKRHWGNLETKKSMVGGNNLLLSKLPLSFCVLRWTRRSKTGYIRLAQNLKILTLFLQSHTVSVILPMYEVCFS